MNFIYFIIFIVFNNIVFSNFLITEEIARDLYKPIFLCAPENSSDSLFIIQQDGIIKLYEKDRIVDKPILDISSTVFQSKMPGDERGLLGAALHPDFNSNHQIFVNYIDLNDYSIISRITLDFDKRTNVYKEKIILRYKQPYSNHNGGHIEFGPDKMLYIGIGDGGFAGDPHGHGQNKNSFFGSILRINVEFDNVYKIPDDNPFYFEDEVKKEIWCYGLRNPWRFSFDKLNGDIYIGDVGQNNWEEINYSKFFNAFGKNFGWNIMEGNHCYPIEKKCDNKKYVMPIFEYPNNANYIKTLIGWKQHDVQGCSITGGYVYRGNLIDELKGKYIFGDYCSGKIWSFRVEDGKANSIEYWEIKNIFEELYISSFGEDGNGELYIINHTGEIYKIIDVL